MSKMRIGLIVLAIVMIIFNVVKLNFSDLSWSANSSSYIGILSMVFVIGTMIASNKNAKRE